MPNFLDAMFSKKPVGPPSQAEIAAATAQYARLQNRIAVGEAAGMNPISQASSFESFEDFLKRTTGRTP